jgi:hypothetical protein
MAKNGKFWPRHQHAVAVAEEAAQAKIDRLIRSIRWQDASGRYLTVRCEQLWEALGIRVGVYAARCQILRQDAYDTARYGQGTLVTVQAQILGPVQAKPLRYIAVRINDMLAES